MSSPGYANHVQFTSSLVTLIDLTLLFGVRVEVSVEVRVEVGVRVLRKCYGKG